MSVLVKGMEMPESCEDCWFNFNLFFSRCGLTRNKLKYIGDKNDDCPFVEIPSKHGDLIDRDFLNNSNLIGWQKALVQAEINKAPTIIEAEE